MTIITLRLVAAFIDYFIILFFATGGAYIASGGSLEVSVTTVLVFFLLLIPLTIVKDALFQGSSIGKRMMRLQLVKTDHSPLRLTDHIKRNTFLFVFPLEVLLVLSEKQRLGDRFAGTTILRREVPTKTVGENPKIKIKYLFWVAIALLILSVFLIPLLELKELIMPLRTMFLLLIGAGFSLLGYICQDMGKRRKKTLLKLFGKFLFGTGTIFVQLYIFGNFCF